MIESHRAGAMARQTCSGTRTACLMLSAIVGLAASAASPASAGAPVNVLFLIADDLNCDLGCYGHAQVRSPHIDRLSERGLRFTQAYCQYPLCGPSRASLMCGLYPDQTLIHANSIRIRECLPDVRTLPQLFRSHGYTAARVGKIYHYNVPKDIGTAGHDDPASWDITVNPRGRDKDEESKIFSLKPGQFGATLSWLAADGEDAEQTDGVGATEAVRLLERFAADRAPFFLAVGFYRPHTPYVAPKKYFDLYPLERISVPQVPEGYLDSLPKPARATVLAHPEQVNLPDENARRAIQAYHAATSFMDAQVGRVLDALDRLGLAENTIVLFTSDHGYHMGEHGTYQKRTLFENASHVPLILRVPRMKTAGQSTDALAEMVDCYPTLAALAGLSPPGNLPGVSLVPVLSEPGLSVRPSALTQLATGYSLRTSRYRYTEWGPDGKDGTELYDRDADPAEIVNMAGRSDRGKILVQLSAELRSRIQAARRAPEGLQQIRPPGGRPKAESKQDKQEDP